MEHYPLQFRLYPDPAQTTMLSKTAGCARYIYNHFLELTLEKFLAREELFDAYNQIKELPELKKILSWLNEADSTALQQAVLNLGRGYKNFLEGLTRPPKKHKKFKRDSFRITMSNQINLVERKIKIGKLGWIQARGNFEGYKGEKIKNISAKRDSDGNWYCSVLIVRETITLEHNHRFSACGIDIGVAKPLTVAYTGKSGDHHKFLGLETQADLRKKEIRRKRYQRANARKVKHSNNWKKAKRKVGKAYHKEKMVRRDWQEKTSHKLAKTFSLISIEDLKLASMSKSAKGTVDKPGKNVKAKSGLNRELLRMGFSHFMTRLGDKCKKFGGQLIRVNPRHTSLDCSCCGYRSKGKESRKNQSRYVCVVCGHTQNADVNAAFNIRNRALA